MNKLILFVFMTYSPFVMSAPISNIELFYRCYKRVTQSFPRPSDAYVTRVKGGADPIVECLKVLDKAQFTVSSNNRISSTSDVLAKRVLRTMHSVHLSWMTNKTFASGGQGSADHMINIIDYNGPSLFITKALFDFDYQFKNILTGFDQNYESYRTDNDPDKGAYDNIPKFRVNHLVGQESYPFVNLKFAPKGELLGVSPYSQKSFTTHVDSLWGLNVRDYALSWGGGVIGSNTYVMANLDEVNSFRANGGTKVYRKWARAVFNDFMCRDFPVVRYADVKSFVSSSSTISFRNSESCVRCHVSMDRSATTISNAKPGSDKRSGSLRSSAYIAKYDQTKPAGDPWPIDNDYFNFLRPTKGTFYFRTHDGSLINKPLTDVESLGKEIIKIDAPYICMAKRYYQYFTGVDANITDLGDPHNPERNLNDQQTKHRNQVISLGKAFKTHQSLRRLIEDIVKKPQFRDAKYEVTE